MSFQMKMNVCLVVGTIVAMVVGMYLANRREKLAESGQAEQAKRAAIHKRYVFYSTNLLCRKRFRRILMSFSSLMCFDFETLKEESVKLFEKAVIIAFAIPVVAFVLTKDVTLAMLTALIGYVFYDRTVDKKIDKQEVAIIGELTYTVQSIRDTYSVTDNIPRAVMSCERGQYLERPIGKIYEILTEENGEELLQEFKRVTPVRLLSTLATMCYISNDEGDLKGNDGNSAFRDELTVLRQEADSRIRYLTKTAVAFKSLSTLAMVGLLIQPVIDMFLLNQIPGSALYVKGLYGSVEKTIIIMLTLVAYYIISVLTRPSVVNQVDRIEWINNLGRNPRVKNFIKTLMPKKFKTRQKLINRINGSISSKNMEYVYTMKVVMSVIFGIATFMLCMVFTWSAKSVLYNNVGTLSFIPDAETVTTEERVEQLRELDKEYLSAPMKMPDEDASTLVNVHVPGLTDMEIESQVDRLSTKWDYYYDLGFKWYYVFIAYLAAIVGWYSPEISLSFRKTLVSYEATEDIMQLQTMMLTLANTKMDVYKALHWLKTESTIHKAPLLYACLEYPSGPEEALENLKNKVTERDMRRLISKLEKAIYDLSLSEAFSDIALDKNQSLVINEILQDKELESKTQMAKFIVQATFLGSILGGGVAPIMLLGVRQITTALTGMGG